MVWERICADLCYEGVRPNIISITIYEGVGMGVKLPKQMLRMWTSLGLGGSFKLYLVSESSSEFHLMEAARTFMNDFYQKFYLGRFRYIKEEWKEESIYKDDI